MYCERGCVCGGICGGSVEGAVGRLMRRRVREPAERPVEGLWRACGGSGEGAVGEAVGRYYEGVLRGGIRGSPLERTFEMAPVKEPVRELVGRGDLWVSCGRVPVGGFLWGDTCGRPI
jgi:hypothetical protein